MSWQTYGNLSMSFLNIMSVRSKTPISSSKFTPGGFVFVYLTLIALTATQITHLLTLKPQELLFGIWLIVITNNNPNIVSVAEKRMLQLPCIGNPASWVQIHCWDTAVLIIPVLSQCFKLRLARKLQSHRAWLVVFLDLCNLDKIKINISCALST